MESTQPIKKLKLPLSAIVVGFNEGKLLKSCLSSITFCDEIIYFDLGSKDNSLEIAEKYADTIIYEKAVVVEIIHEKYYQQTLNEWLLITDPDERIDPSLYQQIQALFLKPIDDNIGALRVPCHFYFKQHKLKGTVWGGANKRILIVNNKRFKFIGSVHSGRKLKEGFEFLEIADRGNNCVHHFWMQSYTQLWKKHIRYLKKEGEARYKNGVRTSIKKILIEPFKQFHFCFIQKKGFKDAFIGFFLSLFWAWYQTSALINLYKYQSNNKHILE